MPEVAFAALGFVILSSHVYNDTARLTSPCIDKASQMIVNINIQVGLSLRKSGLESINRQGLHVALCTDVYDHSMKMVQRGRDH